MVGSMGWMNGRMDELMDGRQFGMDGWMLWDLMEGLMGWINGSMNGWMDGYVNGLNGRMNVCMNVWDEWIG